MYLCLDRVGQTCDVARWSCSYPCVGEKLGAAPSFNTTLQPVTDHDQSWTATTATPNRRAVSSLSMWSAALARATRLARRDDDTHSTRELVSGPPRSTAEGSREAIFRPRQTLVNQPPPFALLSRINLMRFTSLRHLHHRDTRYGATEKGGASGRHVRVTCSDSTRNFPQGRRDERSPMHETAPSKNRTLYDTDGRHEAGTSIP